MDISIDIGDRSSGIAWYWIETRFFWYRPPLVIISALYNQNVTDTCCSVFSDPWKCILFYSSDAFCSVQCAIFSLFAIIFI